jgi:hypothetical protein
LKYPSSAHALEEDVDLQLAIYCNAPRYKVRTYNTEELVDDKKTAFQAYIF